jgi:hypothetical protein
MKHTKLFFMAFTMLTLACNVLSQPIPFWAEPTSTAADINLDSDCPDPQPTQDFIDSVVDYKSEVFQTEGWKRSYAVMESRVSVTWRNDPLGAIINIDHVIFCDVTNARIDEYYVDSFFDVMFQNYEGYEPVRDCRSDDMRLYEFKAKSSGYDYNARFWVELVDGDHTRETLLVFPVDDITNMTTYSNKIMSQLTTCE